MIDIHDRKLGFTRKTSAAEPKSDGGKELNNVVEFRYLETTCYKYRWDLSHLLVRIKCLSLPLLMFTCGG
jgi:hypothetical protein